ncbi:MAG: hypothetical protein ACYS7M_14160 [Planctomycetota bacterium]|jgi:hypothetical protein
MITRIPKWLRWILFVPVSLAAGFLVAGAIGLVSPGGANAPGGALAYAAAFLSGVGYVWAAVYTAHAVAPSHKAIAAAVLGVLILGDMAFVHLVLPSDVFQTAGSSPPAEGGLGVLLRLLRADDYSGLPNGGLLKVGGVLTGLVLVWWNLSEAQRRAYRSGDAEDQASA